MITDVGNNLQQLQNMPLSFFIIIILRILALLR